MIIRKIKNAEFNEVMKLALDVYMEFEAPDYGEEGVETFIKDIIKNENFKNAVYSGENRIWGAFIEDKLVGLIGMRGESHICLVFTHKEYHRKGIATKIMNTVISDIRKENPNVKSITLNSSPYGVPFYHKFGFVDTDCEQLKNGIRYTPMIYLLEEEDGCN